MTDPAVPAVLEHLARLSAAVAAAGVDAVLITPGADLAYLAGHSVGSHERLTALVVGPAGAALLVPALERPGWLGSPFEAAGLPIATWLDGQDCYAALTRLLPAGARALAVDDHMPAMHALGAQAAVPGAALRLAGPVLAGLRMIKTADEVLALARIGSANDRVQQLVGEWLRPGRSEHEVAADISAALVAEGHARAEFVIVGSGPNGASPHHEASDRTIQPGDAVVVDIGGPGADGYYSDCTRTYLVAGGEPDPDLAHVHEVVRRAQAAGVAAVRPGVTAESVDAAARDVIIEAGYGDHFITRTGHGIGLQVHEHPYVVAGNLLPLAEGMAFSVEPGVYLPGRFGVRIEDIVVVGPDGPLLMNNCSTELRTVGAGHG